jgi:peroxiredoxin Q/BCP
MKIRGSFGVGLAIVIAFVGGARAVAAEPKVGDQAPAFSLEGSDGKVHSLQQFEGQKAVVIAWFPKAFTGG